MLRGMFKSFVHDHYCDVTADGQTLMRDELRFEAPLGPLGWIAERLVLRRYFIRFLEQRNEAIRKIAEDPSEGRKRYLI
jgi:ligand-binding SRPBCC domain-containing protein